MSDGAHLGLDAETSMRAVLGATDALDNATPRNPVEMRAYLMAHEPPPTSYDTAAACAGRMVLEFLLADPSRASMPTGTVFAHDDAGRMVFDASGRPTVVHPGLYHEMTAAGVPIDDLGLSGFQWGWAVNAARYCVELGPVANPAILIVEVRE